MESNQMVPQNASALSNLERAILGEKTAFFTTLPQPADDAPIEEKINNASQITRYFGKLPRISDLIGETIDLTHVLVHPIEVVDRDTGEVKPSHRVVLVSADGAAYQGTSEENYGLLAAIRTIFQLLGGPNKWPEGKLTVKVRQIETNNDHRMFSLEVAPLNSKK